MESDRHTGQDIYIIKNERRIKTDKENTQISDKDQPRPRHLVVLVGDVLAIEDGSLEAFDNDIA